MKSTLTDVITNVIAQLQTITTANGCAFDVGTRVYFGRKEFDGGSDTFPLINLAISSESGTATDEEVTERVQLVITILRLLGQTDVPHTVALETLDALRTVVTWVSADVAGNAISDDILQFEPLEMLIETPDDGGQILAVSQAYNFTYVEKFGSPIP